MSHFSGCGYAPAVALIPSSSRLVPANRLRDTIFRLASNAAVTLAWAELFGMSRSAYQSTPAVFLDGTLPTR